MKVQLAIAQPDRQVVVLLELAQGGRVADALACPQAAALLAGRDPASLTVGIWSRRCGLDAPLREGDRIEVYRPLQADAKQLRRERARLRTSTRPRSAP